MKQLQFQSGNFILTITRISSEKNQLNLQKKQVTPKRKLSSINNKLYIYQFDNFDNFCEYCSYINSINDVDLFSDFKKSFLYLYKGNYYLVLHTNSSNIKHLKSFHYIIIEFAICLNNSSLFERKLIEYGKIIFKENAISSCLKHFKN